MYRRDRDEAFGWRDGANESQRERRNNRGREGRGRGRRVAGEEVAEDAFYDRRRGGVDGGMHEWNQDIRGRGGRRRRVAREEVAEDAFYDRRRGGVGGGMHEWNQDIRGRGGRRRRVAGEEVAEDDLYDRRRGGGGRRGGNQNFRGRGGRGRGGGNYALNYRQLAELQNKDPSTIVLTLGLDSGLGPLLNKTTINSDTMYLIARVLAESCSCKSAPENLVQILLTVVQSMFTNHANNTLQEACIRPQENESEKRQFIKDLLTFMNTIAIRLPHSYMNAQILGMENYLYMIIQELALSGGDLIDDELLEKKEELQDIKITLIDKVARPNHDLELVQGQPPCDFRDIPIFPNAEDIHPDEKPFLRENIALGGYTNLEHYLDVQFRLLREDFVSPLRDGIAEYLEAAVPGQRGQKLKDIRVYHDVHVIRTVCSDGGLLHRLSFDVSRLGRVRWENSKRLIYGSLVCLSHDNFQTLLFATVSDRDPKKLQDGMIDVLFENNNEMEDIITMDTQFVMVETSAYFEAYRHVLKALQTLHDGDLPFEKYIVSCANEVEASMYLRLKATSRYDLRPLVDENMVLRENTAMRHLFLLQGREFIYDWSMESMCAKEVQVLDHHDWPSAEQLHLDSSQYRAVKTALTKEFVIIQGPPGTGKTYVGLKIVKALLHNSKMWSDGDTSPMLIVCYTNHALDQFLEGVVSYFKGDVIRVGGRMKSEILEECSMKAKKQKARKSKTRDMRTTGRMRWQIREEIMDLKLMIEQIGLQIEAAEREILHEDVLRPFMREHYEFMLMTMDAMLMSIEAEGYQITPGPAMVEWLGIGNIEDVMFTVEQAAAEDEVVEDEYEVEMDFQGEAEIMQEQRIIEDIFDDFGELDHLQRRINNLQHEQGGYIAFDVTNLDRGHGQRRVQTNDLQFQLPPKARKQLKRCLVRQLRSSQKMPAAEANRVRDPWGLHMNDRWRLYRYWVSQFTERLGADVREKEGRYKETIKQYKESQMIEDKQIMEMATVIGMTTTAAGRYQQVLAEIGPKIIVVEEAAEVLEGHIITTLSKRCQHLILIGDHKQLKPNPTVYKLAKQFNLDLSLFERMVNNGVHCDTLELQHRMRPEISRLMKPIYPTLQDHPSVLNFEQIKGVSGNIFFVNHGYPEEGDAEMRSHSNQFEADYVVALCSYLLKQGYQRAQITVLTTYSGQLFKLKKLMPKQTFEGVKLTVVDNYQGEENDIILLSLVRSNPDGKAGFLKIENRVCVALSRAKYGLFVIGNFDMLTQESLLWKEIVMDMKRNNMIGTSLNLYCQNHPEDDGIAARDHTDFMKAPEGGCMKQCSFRLNCGHVCSRLCHPCNPQHEKYKCCKPCPKKICGNDHSCPRLCYQECKNCQVPVRKILPLCGHIQMVPCSMATSNVTCKGECEKIMKCGHRCGNPCGMKHQCRKMMTITWRCGHAANVPCMRMDSAKCMAKCTEVLKCGHTCRGNCHDCHEGRLHVPCRNSCKRILVCGHECGDKCSYCPPCTKQCRNRCPHTKCYKICGEICVSCKKPCKWECAHYKCTKKCSEPCNRPPCNEPCTKRLPCRHPCIGLCGEPCPRLCRICNKDEVTTIIFGTEDESDARFVELEDCGHVIEVSALDQFMGMKNDDDTIQLKGCPRCKTEIRRNVRYGSQIKDNLKDIERVKRIQIGKDRRIRELKAKLELEADTERDPEERKEKQQMVRRGYYNTESGLTAIDNQFRFLKSVSKVFDAYEKLGAQNQTVALRAILADVLSNMKELEKFRTWLKISRFAFTEQEQSDAQNELLRHKSVLRLLHMKTIFTTRQLELDVDMTREMAKLEGMLKNGKPYTEDRQARAKDIFQRLKEHIPESGLGISQDEKVEILKAMDLSK